MASELCHRCGGNLERGYGRLRLEMRGCVLGGKRLKIHGVDDRDDTFCLTCVSFYEVVLDAFDAVAFASYMAGRNSAREP